MRERIKTKIIFIASVSIMACLIVFFAISMMIGVKACLRVSDQIGNKGLKNIIEDVWEGKGKSP